VKVTEKRQVGKVMKLMDYTLFRNEWKVVKKKERKGFLNDVLREAIE
jgi:hypothetical protein